MWYQCCLDIALGVVAVSLSFFFFTFSSSLFGGQVLGVVIWPLSFQWSFVNSCVELGYNCMEPDLVWFFFFFYICIWLMFTSQNKHIIGSVCSVKTSAVKHPGVLFNLFPNCAVCSVCSSTEEGRCVIIGNEWEHKDGALTMRSGRWRMYRRQ